MTLRFLALVPVLAMAPIALGYEYPLSSSAVRDACLLGTSSNGEPDKTLAEYTHVLPGLKVEMFSTTVSIDAPYTQIAQYCRQKLNYPVQDAEKEFGDRPMQFRIHMEIYFNPSRSTADNLHDLTIKLGQDDKEIAPLLIGSEPIVAPHNDNDYVESIGERVDFVVKAGKIGSSDLNVQINTSDGHQGETTFDLARLK
ncbi:MAG TPA: hypothetical protein VK757_06465 [Candidatus Acidoferrum sp.]|jgi:hypothetical protein|nr:hypothetical protein [Candidatus Acidoferrum sp.]